MNPPRFHPAMSATTPATNPPGTVCPHCNHLACVCNIRKEHAPRCKFRIAASGPIGIPCPHGRDCCPICDPCTCDNDKVEL